MWHQVIKILILFAIGQIYCQKNQQNVEPCNTAAASNGLIKRFGLNEKLFNTCKRNDNDVERTRRGIQPIFKGKPKMHAEILANKFKLDAINYDQTLSLVSLVNKIAKEYLSKCPPAIYYDTFVEKSDSMILESIFKTFPTSFYHGDLNENYVPYQPGFSKHIDNNCKSYILFLSEPLMTRQIIGPQTESRVVVISRSSQWKLRDFLASESSSNIFNLLVIGESLIADPNRERPYVLYTHKLFTDGLGSNAPVVLTSWIRGMLSRPHINLFPPKLESGFAGHRFQIAAVNQPPFIFRISRIDSRGNSMVHWDGIEYRLMDIIAKQLNFSIEIIEPQRRSDIRGAPELLQNMILTSSADMCMSGIYITDERILETDMSVGHSEDCATFITLASKALPKYRAIMGPFQWPVWVALTFVYLGAIFPIVYTDRLSLKHLIGNWGEIENMFWYVFGMFTNSFTFKSKYSWGNTQKTSTRLLIGCYWLFTIIITACYTGSIIAFVTLPAFPDTVDSVVDLLGLFFRVGTLDNGGWEKWFQNSTHVPTTKLLKKMEYVATVEEGIGNITKSFFWNYAFLGSRAQLEYLVQSNFSDDNISRRSALHLSEECFAPFQIGILFPKEAVYKHKIDSLILLAQQSGLINKINNEVSWAMQRSSSGRLLQASSSNALRERIQEERQLTTADTEGMFLLMGIGYLMGAIALVSEIVGGITNKCRQIIKRSRKSISSGWTTRKNSRAESIDGNGENDDTSSTKHERRKHVEVESQKKQGFGRREYNLTKRTLKELYGNYYKPEPNYIVKHGQLLLESDDISTISTNFDSRNSSANQMLSKRRSKTMVLAHVDVDGDNESLTSNGGEDVQESLTALDNSLVGHFCDDISEESSAELAREANLDDVEPFPPHEEQLFGSFVGQEEVFTRVDNLSLFKSEAELEKLEMEAAKPFGPKVDIEPTEAAETTEVNESCSVNEAEPFGPKVDIEPTEVAETTEFNKSTTGPTESVEENEKPQ